MVRKFALITGFVTASWLGLVHAQPTNARIIGGGNAREGGYPWMVALAEARGAAIDTHFCGGALIDRQYILTAAHCAEYIEQSIGVENTRVILGRTDLESTKGAVLPIKGVILHPLYDSETRTYDLALLKLTAPVSISPAGIVSDRTAQTLVPDQSLLILGWGRTHEEYPVLPSILQEARVPLIADGSCRTMLGRWFTAETMMCAGKLATQVNPVGHVDSCKGDSGGPLLADTDEGQQVVGVVSWGFGCDPRFPGVYARVSVASDWIRSKPPVAPRLQESCTTNLSGERYCDSYTSRPKILGQLVEGSTLTCDKGLWAGEEIEFSFEWFRSSSSDGAGYTPITDATSDNYQLQSTDVGQSVACRVTAFNRSGRVVLAAFGESAIASLQSGGSGATTPKSTEDTAAPRSYRSSVSCSKVTCRLTVGVEDEQPSSGIARVRGVVTVLKVSTARGRPAKRKTIRAAAQSSDLWSFNLDQFHGAQRLRVRVASEDAAGNIENPPLTVMVRRKNDSRR